MTKIRLKRLFESVSGGSWGTEPEEGEVTLPCIRGTDFDYPALRSTIATAPVRGFSHHEVAKRAARRGDLIIEKSGGGEKQPVGRVVLHDFDDLVMPTNFASRLTPSEANESRFLTYLMSSLYAGGTTKSSIKQTTGIQNLDVKSFLDTVVFRPSLPEQRAIADFLDAETARIDALIEKKRKLAVLMRQRFRTQADILLEGVDNLVPLRRLISRLTSGPRGWASHVADDGAAFLTIANVRRDDVELKLDNIVRVIAPDNAEARRTRVQEGDVLLSITADIGSVGVVRDELGETYVSQHLALMTPDRCLPDWLAFAIWGSATQRQLDSARYGGTKTQLALEDVADVRVPWPAYEEQQRLVQILRSVRRRHLEVVRKLGQQIELLTEHRQALITAAVTGQLNVAVS